MISWMTLVNFSMCAGGLMIILVALLSVLISRSTEESTRRFFINFFTMLLLYVAANFCGQISALFTRNMLITMASLFLESFASSVLLVMLTAYLLRCCGQVPTKRPLMYVVTVLWLAYVALLVYTQFTETIYYFTPQNDYHRGPYYPVLLVPPVLIILTDLIALLFKKKKLSKRQFSAFFAYLLIPMAAMLLQSLFYGLYLIVFASAVSALFFFLTMLRDQDDQAFAQREENIRQRASISALQMRPHFIYNTMTSIYYLCRQDPEKAQQVILDFTTYLRKNFTAIGRNETIPFEEELEHTRAYLAVELVRFEDQLVIDFDTPHTAFRLPPLTLQPIVENAVKHGLDPELKELHILIRTRRTEMGSEIVVEDTGVGISDVDNGDPHIGLSNIREKLRIMCRGTIQIGPGKTGGTRVRIYIPDNMEE